MTTGRRFHAVAENGYRTLCGRDKRDVATVRNPDDVTCAGCIKALRALAADATSYPTGEPAGITAARLTAKLGFLVTAKDVQRDRAEQHREAQAMTDDIEYYSQDNDGALTVIGHDDWLVFASTADGTQWFVNTEMWPEHGLDGGANFDGVYVALHSQIDAGTLHEHNWQRFTDLEQMTDAELDKLRSRLPQSWTDAVKGG